MGCLVELIKSFIKAFIEVAIIALIFIAVSGGLIGGAIYFGGSWLVELITGYDIRGVWFGIISFGLGIWAALKISTSE